MGESTVAKLTLSIHKLKRTMQTVGTHFYLPEVKISR